MPEFKKYRRHNCKRKHRTYLTLARCVWKNAIWVRPFEGGDNSAEYRFALVTNCRKPYMRGDQRTVSLWLSAEMVKRQKTFIDRFGCGGGCSRVHEIIELEK